MIELLVSFLFPPPSPAIHPDELAVILNYQKRIGRIAYPEVESSCSNRCEWAYLRNSKGSFGAMPAMGD